MPGLVPGIHALLRRSFRLDVDGRDKPGHDGVRCRRDSKRSAHSRSPAIHSHGHCRNRGGR